MKLNKYHIGEAVYLVLNGSAVRDTITDISQESSHENSSVCYKTKWCAEKQWIVEGEIFSSENDLRTNLKITDRTKK